LIIKSGSPLQRNAVVDVLLQNGIECRPIVGGNFVKNPVIEWFKYEIFETLDNSERIDKFGFFVGNHHYNLSNQIKELHKILQLFGG
jgi:CDP-6-deoxy-D-xylo-4-hexulose-3-dehydrase